MVRKCGNNIFRLKVIQRHSTFFLKSWILSWGHARQYTGRKYPEWCIIVRTPLEARQCSAVTVGRSKDSGVAPWVLSCDCEWGCYWNRAHTLTKQLSYILKPPVTFLWQPCGPVYCTVWETLRESWSKCNYSTMNKLCDLFSSPSSLSILLDFISFQCINRLGTCRVTGQRLEAVPWQGLNLWLVMGQSMCCVPVYGCLER